MFQDLIKTKERMGREIEPLNGKDHFWAGVYALLALPMLYFFVVMYSLILK